MTCGLVLGGGGQLGIGWEVGIVRGLMEAGFALDAVDVIVGTSAGAIVGAQLASGLLSPSRSAPEVVERLLRNANGLAGRAARATSDSSALGQIFATWTSGKLTGVAKAAAIGELVRRLDRSAQSEWIASMDQVVAGASWPERRLLIATVDTATGERRTFERASGAPLARALGASSAVPGLLPAIEIDGGIYMDGMVHSSTNADLLVSAPPARVLIAMPTNTRTGNALGEQAERMLEHELAALRAVGCEVHVRTPSREDTQRMGANLMDLARVRDAYEVGLQSGRAWGSELGV